MHCHRRADRVAIGFDTRHNGHYRNERNNAKVTTRECHRMSPNDTDNLMAVDIINPYDGSVVGAVDVATQHDVGQAVARAFDHRDAFRQMPAHMRSRILSRASELIQRDGEEFASLITRESGKPMRYARGEVARCVETFTFAASEALRIHGETIPMDAAQGGVGRMGYYLRVPVGVVAAITPFNFPLNLVAHKVAPAIAAGCPIVLKPAPTTPLTALRLMDVLRQAGLPDAAFQVVIGDGDVGGWLTTDERVAMISFTGSVAVAQQISQIVGIRRVTFELGGNAAVLIDETTELTDTLIDRLAAGCFAYSGQVCISVQRLYVHRSLADELTARLAGRAVSMQRGDPMDETTEIGPMITQQASKRIEQWVAQAVERGAQVLAGGDRDGQYYAPTVLTAVPDDVPLMCDEAFGPIVNVIPFDDFDQALDAINDSQFGLQAGVYTQRLDHTMRATDRLQVGGVIINDTPSYRVDHMPYGGDRQSGIGREGPRFAIEDMTTIKMVVLNS